MVTGAKILGGWAKQLMEAGVVPPNTRRLVIDISIDEPVKVYYDCYGDDKMFTAELAVALEKAEVIHAGEAASEPCDDESGA